MKKGTMSATLALLTISSPLAVSFQIPRISHISKNHARQTFSKGPNFISLAGTKQPETETTSTSELPATKGLQEFSMPEDELSFLTPNGKINRRAFVAAAAAAASSAFLFDETANAADLPSDSSTITTSTSSSPQLPWEANPVNRRSGVTVFDAEKAGYNVAFVTYLSRFLLNFDPNCQRYWFFTLASQIPRSAKADEVEQIRIDQFAAFSASVELGLIPFEGANGPTELLRDLVQRYGTVATPSQQSSTSDDEAASQKRIAKSARRHLSLLFGLLETNQPTKEITKLLASVDNGSVTQVQLDVKDAPLDGYEMGTEPTVSFPPPQAGEDYETAQGRAILKPTGEFLRVDVVSSGSGYSSSNPPSITVSAPPSQEGATAKLQAKIVKGSIESIKILDPGSGYTDNNNIQITVSSPQEKGGETAVLSPVLNMALDGIEISNGGTGYAVEKPLKIFVTPPDKGKNKRSNAEPILVGRAFPTAEKTSFASFRKDDDTFLLKEQQAKFDLNYKLKGDSSTQVRGFDGDTPPLPFWTARSSSSSELLRLLPAGVGLEYDTTAKRYALAMDTDFMAKYPAVLQQQQGSNRLIGTEFGPRGRAPIERDMTLGISAYLRFALSGATCASLVHVALTPLDVAKTKLQTAPDKYPNIGKAFQLISKEEGLPNFFSGWLPTVLGNFFAGGVLYVTTEFIRRSLSELAGVDAIALEVPIILAAAGVASALGAIISCPFEAVRIRTVAQPDFASDSVEVFNKMLKDEGVGSLLNAIPVFLIRNVPYAMTKFTIFDLSTERLYAAFPATQEDIKLSLLVSLVGGILGGTAAACVSNPADAIISELKKAKSDISFQEAVSNMLERNGIATFFVGLPLRIVFYSLIASLTFSVYDFVRFLLQIGPDDLKLYLDVLGGSLANPS